MHPPLALLFSLVVVVVGYVLATALERRRRLSMVMDGLVLVLVAGLCLMFLLPEAYSALGGWAFPLALVGLILPALTEARLHRHDESPWLLLLALGGVALHSSLDGAGLAMEEDGHHATTIAILAHRLPVGLLLGSTVLAAVGRTWALGSLGLILLATLGGFLLGPQLEPLHGAFSGVVVALLAGGLLHVVVGHGHAERREHAGWAGAGALVGVALVALLPLERPQVLEAGFRSALGLFLESSPAILIGFLGAGLLSLIPTATLAALMKGRNAFTSALRGVVFGLPIPICSCGVVPIYRGLMRRGVPPAAAIAFLIATPELGVDAVLISIPLLGWKLTLTRFLTAVAVALVAGLCVAGLTNEIPEEEPPAEPGQPEPRWTVFRRGFDEALDELGPWMVVGLVVAGMLYPVLQVAWLESVSPSAQVPLFSAFSAPFYLCASSATPVAAVFLAKGVAVGAVLAFLITGPATNVTTWGALRLFHTRKVAVLTLLTILFATIAIGLLVNRVPFTTPRVLEQGTHEHGWVSWVAGALFGLLLIVSLLRQGPRGFLGRLGLGHHHGDDACGEPDDGCGSSKPDPCGDHGHDHGHEHGHGHASETGEG